MDWKKILLKAIGKFHDVLLKTQPSVVDLEGSIKEHVNETRFVGMVYKFCVQAVMPAMSAKPPGIFPLYMSTFSVTGPLKVLNTYKILSNAALYALMTVSVS